jgi:hypothetical protein
MKQFYWLIKRPKHILKFFECKKPGTQSYPPTKVNLNIYDAMPHVFQLFLFHPAASNAVKRTGAFIRKVIPEPSNDASSYSSHLSSSSSSHSSSSSRHRHRQESDLKVTNSLKQKLSSSSLQELFDDEFDEDVNDDGEINYFTNKHIDIKGNCKRINDMLDEGTLREWVNMLGKFPDLENHPEFLDV